jgi:hypothetical protein
MGSKISSFIFHILVVGAFVTSSLNAQDSTKVKNENKEKEQSQHGPKFVDKDGDGFNDNAPDHDGDGIPNGLDADYKRPGKEGKKKFVDLDGDGIDDNIYSDEIEHNGKGMGPKNKSTSTQSGENKQSMKRKRTGKK